VPQSIGSKRRHPCLSQGAPSDYYLSAASSLSEKGVRSQYRPVEHSTYLNGLRIKYTFSFSATGQSAPIFITVGGLTKSELSPEKCPSGVLLMKIPGLAVGAAIDPHNTQIGFLCFCRSDEDDDSGISVEQRRQEIYLEHAYFPFIAASRQAHDGIMPGSEIPDSKGAVGWCDGDWPQIKACVTDEMLGTAESHKVCMNKHAAAASLIQQPADLACTFKVVGRLQNTMTEKDRNCTFADRITGIIKTHPALNLGLKKLKATADATSCAPKLLQHACASDHIRESFVAGGMTDKGSESCPDYDVILGTCRRAITKEEYDLVEKHFSTLYDHAIKFGHISDELLDQLGFPVDLDMNDNPVHRDAGISQEPYQRAKCLSHKAQQKLRQERVQEAQEAEALKRAASNLVITRRLQSNKACEDAILKDMNQTRDSNATNQQQQHH
jgi:hypothetical protein